MSFRVHICCHVYALSDVINWQGFLGDRFRWFFLNSLVLTPNLVLKFFFLVLKNLVLIFGVFMNFGIIFGVKILVFFTTAVKNGIYQLRLFIFYTEGSRQRSLKL